MNNLIPIEFRNQRIMTTKLLAEQYGTDEKILSNNFNRNLERFIEGKHYFKLQGEELKEFKGYLLNDESLKFVSVLVLWTEKGALRHAKILETDEAWEVYEHLEETYFRLQENKPTCIEDVLIQSLQEMKDMKRQLNEVNHKVDQNLGGNEHIKDVRKEAYALLDKRMSVSLEIRLTNKRRRMADEGVCKSKRDKLNKMDVIADDKKLIEGYVAIVKEMVIKYGV